MATPSGQQAIGSLKVGDTVLAYNPATGKSESEPVQHVWRTLDHDLVDVQLTLAGSPAAGAPTSSAHDARGRNSVMADSARGATRTTATPTRLHRWVASGVLAAGLGATLLTTPIAPAQAAGATTTTATTPAQTEVIHTTANHPWLTAYRGWVHAGDLRPGERVVTLPAASGQTGSAGSATTATVAWVRAAPGAAEMDNLTVAQDHTYAVGDAQAVVHNFGGGPPDVSRLTDYGLNLIERMREMGVNVVLGGEDVEAWARFTGANGGTKFWGNSPAETDVYLTDAAVDHTVYEEYLHVLRGVDRGWVSANYPENFLEEAQVKEAVLLNADNLGMTDWERNAMQGQIEEYYRLYSNTGAC